MVIDTEHSHAPLSLPIRNMQQGKDGDYIMAYLLFCSRVSPLGYKQVAYSVREEDLQTAVEMTLNTFFGGKK